ncbi:MAG: insulinase family protein, partial [Deltaproteobacteria bacterium]
MSGRVLLTGCCSCGIFAPVEGSCKKALWIAIAAFACSCSAPAAHRPAGISPAGADGAAEGTHSMQRAGSEEDLNAETIGSTRRFRLHQGLVMVGKPRPGSGLVAAQLWLDAGSASDPPGKAGLAHLLEHMVFKGRNGERFSRLVEEAGGDSNAWTSYDETVFYMQVPKAGFIPALDALLEAVFHPGFDPKDVGREKQVVIEEINTVRDSPERWLGDLLFAEAFGEHPYGRNILGDPEQLSSIGPAAISGFHARWYRPSNMVLSVVGDADIEAVAGHVDNRLRRMKWPKRDVNRASGTAEVAAKARVRVVGADVAQAYFMLGWPVPGILHPDAPALELLASVLGAGESARLVEQLRNRAGLVSDVYSYLHAGLRGGLFVVGGSCRPSMLHRVFHALGGQLAQLWVPVPEDELARTKAVLEADELYMLESVEGEARTIAAGQVLAGDPRHADEHLRRLLALDGDALAAVAEKYLAPDGASLVVMVPRG